MDSNGFNGSGYSSIDELKSAMDIDRFQYKLFGNNETTSAAYTQNFYLLNGMNYILTCSTTSGVGCYLITTISAIYWTEITPLPSGISIARADLTLGVTYQQGNYGICSLVRL